MKLVRHLLVALGFGAATLAAIPASSSVIVTASEAGSDVLVTGAGTLDTSALALLLDDVFVNTGVQADDGFAVGDNGLGLIDGYTGISGPTSFGPGTAFFGAPGSADLFGVLFTPSLLLITPETYVSGSALSGSLTIAGETLASMGLAVGSYTWTWGSGGSADSLTLNILPEPSAGMLFAIGLAGMMAGKR